VWIGMRGTALERARHNHGMGGPLRFAVQGAELAGERHEGRGPIVVALHAGVADRRAFDGVVANLAGRATVVTYDRRGHGDSPPATARFNALDDLGDVLDAVGHGPAWLLGNSVGGKLALDLALRAPDRVAGLILISPAVSGAPEQPLDPDTQRLSDRIDEAVAAGDLQEVNRLEAWLWLDGPAVAEGRVGDPARALVLAMNATALAAEERQGELEDDSGIDAWARLEQIAVPVTVACGTLDLPMFRDRCRELAARLPRAEHVALEGVAHLPSLEAPAVVAELVRRALDG
jgi:pimeloyl-ACP methyl ester carboxylesterase